MAVGVTGGEMRILLVNSNTKGDVLAAPPIGLCYVASAARSAGHDVHVLDLCFRRDITKDLRSTVQRISPDVIGISIRNIDNVNMLHPKSYVPDLERIVRIIRDLSPVPLVLGGAGASLSPEHLLRRLRGDFIVVADGERPFLTLLEDLDSGRTGEGIPGVGLLKEGLFLFTPPALEDFSRGHAEVGRWIDMSPYNKIGSSYNIQTKRGCRHKCIYCTYNQVLEGSKLRLRSPVDVADEIEDAVLRHGVMSFEFVDSVFNDPIDHCSDILEEIARRPWKARFSAMGVNPRGLTPGFLELMSHAGFTSFWITPESASETMIRNYKKGFSLEDVIHAAETVRKTRFQVVWDFLIGGPGETNRTLQETLDFTVKFLRTPRRPPFFTVNFFLGVRIYPRTKLWNMALEDGFIHTDSDPLSQLWYLSHELDLERAFRQMIQAAKTCPEIISGFDEKFLGMSGPVAFLGRMLSIPDLYWRVLYTSNKLLRKALIRFALNPREEAEKLRTRLMQQGRSEQGVIPENS